MRWVGHLRENGFEVEVIQDDAQLAAIKAEHVPGNVGSCHTGLIDGHVVEGHVPASSILRYLEEGSEYDGLTVPGMPIGSPGMEVAGVDPQPYDVLLFNRDGSTEVFEKR